MNPLDLVVASIGQNGSVTAKSASSGDSCNTFVFDAHSGSILMAYKGAQGNGCGIKGATICGHSLLVAHSDKPALTAWAVSKDQPTSRIALPDRFSCMGCSPDGLYLVGGTYSGSIYIWYSLSGQLLKILPEAHYKKVNAVCFLSTGDAFVTCSDDSSIHIWLFADVLNILTPNARISPFKTFTDHRLAVTDISLSSLGWQSRLVSVSLDRTCTVYDLVEFKKLFSVKFPVDLTCVALERNELYCYVGTEKGDIYKLTLLEDDGTQIKNLPFHSAIAPENTMLHHTSSVTSLVILPALSSSSSSSLISSSSDRRVVVWETMSRQPLRILSHHNGPVNCLVLLPRSLFTTHPSQQAPEDLVMPILRRYVQPFPLTQEVLPLDRIHVQPVLLLGHDKTEQKTEEKADREFEDMLNAWGTERENRHATSELNELRKMKETNAALLMANNEMHQLLLRYADE